MWADALALAPPEKSGSFRPTKNGAGTNGRRHRRAAAARAHDRLGGMPRTSPRRRAGERRRGADLPGRRHPGRGLSDRPGADASRQAAAGAHQRAAPAADLPLAAARRGEGDDRADAGRRDRPQPHQRRPDRELRARGERARAAVPVPLRRSPAPGPRRRDRERHPEELRRQRLRRPDLLRFRRALDLQQRPADPEARGSERACASASSSRTS